MDWFVAATPLLLLPILGLFAFVGCSLLFTPTEFADIEIHVSFYPRTLDNFSDVYRIVIQGLNDEDVVEERGPDEIANEQATYKLRLHAEDPPRRARAGDDLEIRCSVFDPDELFLPLATTEAPHCEQKFDADETYLLVFQASTGDNTFVCSVTPL